MKEVQTYRSHKKEVNTVVWHPFHETLFASGGAEGAIYFHVDNQEEPVGSLEGAHDGIVWTLDWHPLGHVLTSGSADCSARFWTRHRPGDTLQDKFILGRQAAEALGLVETNMTAAMAEDEDQLPGLGSDRRPPAPMPSSRPPSRSLMMPPPGWRPSPNMGPIPSHVPYPTPPPGMPLPPGFDPRMMMAPPPGMRRPPDMPPRDSAAAQSMRYPLPPPRGSAAAQSMRYPPPPPPLPPPPPPPSSSSYYPSQRHNYQR